MRRIVFFGKGQITVMATLYQRYAVPMTGDVLTQVAPRADLPEADRRAIEQADMVVEQVLDAACEVDIGTIAQNAHRVAVPLVNADFLWPLAGGEHPANTPTPFLQSGPYPVGDRFLNQALRDGMAPEEAAASYLALDINARVNLDQLHEQVIERQRQRDTATGFRIAEEIEAYFRTEQTFLTADRPALRILRVLAAGCFERMEAPRGSIERMWHGLRLSPFPPGEWPIHPGVARHFGLTFVNDDTRYRFLNEGAFTFRDHVLRYMRGTWNPALAEGIWLRDTGKPSDAEAKLREGLALSPRSAAGRSALAEMLDRLSRSEAAVAQARLAVEYQDDSCDYHGQLAALLQEAGDLESAEAAFRAAIDRDPGNPDLRVSLSRMLRKQARHDDANQILQDIGDALADHAGMVAEYAIVAEHRPDLQAALSRWQRAHERFPTDLTAQLGVARCLRELRRYDEAQAILDTAAAQFPNDHMVVADNAWLAHARADWTTAIARWAVLRERFPQILWGYTMGAAALHAAGRTSDAMALLVVAIDRFPDAPAPAANLARMVRDRPAWTSALAAFRKAGQTEEAEKLIGALVAQLPDELDLAVEYAELAQKRQDWRAASDRWDMVLQRAPDMERAYIEKADVLFKRKLFHEVEAILAAAGDRFPENAAFPVKLASFSMQRMRWQEAADRCAAIRQRFPNEPAGYTEGAEALRILRQFKEADDILASGVQHLPDNPHMLWQYANLPIHHARVDGRDPQLALQRLAIVRERFPKFEPGYTTAAGCLRDQKRGDEAEAILELGLQHVGVTPFLAAAHARQAQDRGDWPEAVARFKAAATRFPNLLRAKIGLANALANTGAFDEADAVLEEAMQRFSNEVSIYTEYAECAMMRQDWPLALQRWKDVYRRFPGQEEAQKMVTLVERRVQNPATAAPVPGTTGQFGTGKSMIFDTERQAAAGDRAASARHGLFTRLRGLFSGRSGIQRASGS